MQDNQEVNLEGLLSYLFLISRWRWAAGVTLETIAIFVGLLGIEREITSPLYAGLISVIGAIGALLVWSSRQPREKAESLLRGKEFRDGLGWDIRALRVADFKQRGSWLRRWAPGLAADQGEFYATKAPQGAGRLLEIILESSWWSKHLARLSSDIVLTAVVVLGVASLYGLPLAMLWNHHDIPPAIAISSLTATICFIMSADLARIAYEYRRFAHAANKTQLACESLKRMPSKKSADFLFEVVIITTEYQVARCYVPPILKSVWHLRRRSLNHDWKEAQKLP